MPADSHLPDRPGPSDRPADPTERFPQVPARTRPQPTVNAPRTPSPSGGTEAAATIINRVLDEQERLNAGNQARLAELATQRQRRTVRQLAADRVARHEAEERRQLRHQQHLDTVEMVKSYVGLACLAAVFVILLIAVYYTYGIGAGWYRWAPVPTDRP